MKTCTSCRIRKVKCDGVEPKCGMCERARRPLECSYVRTTPPPAEALPKGAACQPCRRKKRRCDAERPHCSACIAAGSESACQYDSFEIKFTPNQTPHSFVNTESEGMPSSSSLKWQVYSLSQTPKAGTSSPQITSEMINAWNLQYRVTFLAHRVQLGLHISDTKQKAILSGDTGGSAISPFFISIAQLLGCSFDRRLAERSNDLQQLEATYLRSSLAALTSITTAVELMQADMLLATYYFRSSNAQEGSKYLTQANLVSQREGVRFVQTDRQNFGGSTSEASWPQLSDELSERVTVLAQLMFLEITWGAFTPISPQFFELERQFRSELPCLYPILFEISPIVLRARSALFFKDVNDVILSFDLSAEWSATSHLIFDSLSSHIYSLKSFVIQSDVIQDNEGSLSLRSSLIMCLSSLSELAQFLTPYSLASGQPNYRSACLEALQRISQVTEELVPGDYYHLDLFISISWTKAISVAAGLCSDDFSHTSPGNIPSLAKSYIITLSAARDKLHNL